MADDRLLGDLRERDDGGFDGWCWSAARPDQRMVVDLLVDDTLAVSMVAAIYRRDLMTQGYGDGRHGFLLRLPAEFSARGGEQLITARERRSGTVFGRVLRSSPALLPVGGERLEQVARETEALGQRLAELRQARSAQADTADRLRVVLADLGGHLASRAGSAMPWRAGGLPGCAPLTVPNPRAPALSLILVAGEAAATWRQVAALAPAVCDLQMELVVVDTGHDPAAGRLAERLRHARCLRAAPGTGALPAAAAVASGRLLVLLAGPPAAPSAAALLHLARVVAAHADGMWLGAPAVAAMAAMGEPLALAARLPGRLGLALCLPRDLLAEIGPPDPALDAAAGLEWADLAFKARLLGVPVRGVVEPAPAGPLAEWHPPADAARLRRAHAAFADRWGPVPASAPREPSR